MKKFNALLALALVVLSAVLMGCGREDTNNSTLAAAPGVNPNALQFPQNCVNGVCNCVGGLNQQVIGANPYCVPTQGWNGFGNNICTQYYGPYAMPVYNSWGQITACTLTSQGFQPGWGNQCQVFTYGTIQYYNCGF